MTTKDKHRPEACAMFGHSPEYRGFAGVCVYCFAIRDDDDEI